MSNARLKYTVKGATATEREVAIVIDILRASTVITTALCYDAKWIAPTLEIESAFELAKKYKALLVGERKCLNLEILQRK